MRNILLLVILFFTNQCKSQYSYTYDSIIVYSKNTKKSPILINNIPKKGIIILKENYIQIDSIYYDYSLTLHNEKIGGRYVDSCCQTNTDNLLNSKTKIPYIFYSKYKDYRLIFLSIKNNNNRIDFLNIKQR